jgi:hypothetical protein
VDVPRLDAPEVRYDAYIEEVVVTGTPMSTSAWSDHIVLAMA